MARLDTQGGRITQTRQQSWRVHERTKRASPHDSEAGAPASESLDTTGDEQVANVEVRGWDVAQKRKIVSSVPAGTTSVDLPTMKPADMAKPFGNPNYVASDVAYRKQSEADTAATALAAVRPAHAGFRWPARAPASHARAGRRAGAGQVRPAR